MQVFEETQFHHFTKLEQFMMMETLSAKTITNFLHVHVNCLTSCFYLCELILHQSGMLHVNFSLISSSNFNPPFYKYIMFVRFNLTLMGKYCHPLFRTHLIMHYKSKPITKESNQKLEPIHLP